MAAALLKRLLPAGIKRRLRQMADVPSMASRLQNLKRAGFKCQGAVDGGAFAGEWTRLCRQVFDCPVTALDPVPRPALRARADQEPQVSLVELALSDTAEDSVVFLEQGSNSRMPDAESIEWAAGDLTTVRSTTLDEVLADVDPPPNLLKLDLQGAELKALKGAQRSLSSFEVIICEVSVIPIGDVPDFKQILDFLHDRDFRLYDFLPAHYRPLDGALWQADAFFVNGRSSLVASKRWN